MFFDKANKEMRLAHAISLVWLLTSCPVQKNKIRAGSKCRIKSAETQKMRELKFMLTHTISNFPK